MDSCGSGEIPQRHRWAGRAHCRDRILFQIKCAMRFSLFATYITNWRMWPGAWRVSRVIRWDRPEYVAFPSHWKGLSLTQYAQSRPRSSIPGYPCSKHLPSVGPTSVLDQLIDFLFVDVNFLPRQVDPLFPPHYHNNARKAETSPLSVSEMALLQARLALMVYLRAR